MYTFDFIKFMNKTFFNGINFHLIGTIYYFKREQSVKYQDLTNITEIIVGQLPPIY